MNWESEQILQIPNENFKDSSLTKEHKENKTNKQKEQSSEAFNTVFIR